MTETIYPKWTLSQKIIFRFFFCYFLIYIFPFPLDTVPFASELFNLNKKLGEYYATVTGSFNELLHIIIPSFAKNILHLKNPITIFTNGSGDTTYDYVLVLFFFVIAILATLIWSIIDRKRESYHVAYYWLRTILRFYLLVMMFGYGFAKVMHNQMPSPANWQLVQLFGNKSPMGLTWSFVGFSKGFSAFTGWGEVIAGLLLIFRRTTTAGALLVAVVMANIMAINYCYDVPVKLFSSMLFLMAVFLLAPDASRIWDFFFRNQSTQLKRFNFTFQRRWLRIAKIVYKWLFVIYAFYVNISQNLDQQKQYGDTRITPKFYGIYTTNYFIKNRDTVPPLTTDTSRWKYFIVDYAGQATIVKMNDSMKFYNFTLDTLAHSAEMSARKIPNFKAKLFYSSDSAHIFLNGKIGDDSVEIKLDKFDRNKFLLINRGYNWVNEYPLNR
ncbi:MAG: hypothetical protein C5B52_08515 [Bacteroidetes bacterium]|nr:MAG: hypothetical protein C5B52_08515 [Bacteroidota bacterium]